MSEWEEDSAGIVFRCSRSKWGEKTPFLLEEAAEVLNELLDETNTSLCVAEVHTDLHSQNSVVSTPSAKYATMKWHVHGTATNEVKVNKKRMVALDAVSESRVYPVNKSELYTTSQSCMSSLRLRGGGWYRRHHVRSPSRPPRSLR